MAADDCLQLDWGGLEISRPIKTLPDLQLLKHGVEGVLLDWQTANLCRYRQVIPDGKCYLPSHRSDPQQANLSS